MASVDELKAQILAVLPEGGISWDSLGNLLGKPTMSTLSRAVRQLEADGKVYREQIPKPALIHGRRQPDRNVGPRVLIKPMKGAT